MCLESLVAIMALVAACTLEPGVYFSINVKGTPTEIVAKVNQAGFPVTEKEMTDLAGQLGESTLFGRTGGASTLAVGMATIFSKLVNGRGLDLWYHFAIMFEALFILTTLDAGTRVGRYLLQDFLGHVWKPLGDTSNTRSNVLCSCLVVAGWGYFLIQGVLDPLGGINSLWPLFGIANQLLAAIALCVATTVILKMQLKRGEDKSTPLIKSKPWLAMVTLVPLIWLLSVTMTAGIQKIFHSKKQIGFLSGAAALKVDIAALEQQLASIRAAEGSEALKTVQTKIKTNKILRFNLLLNAVVTGTFLSMVCVIVLLSAREWILLVARKKLAQLSESPPVWLPDYQIAESRPLNLMSIAILFFGLIKELTGEAAIDRFASSNISAQCVCQDQVQRAFAKMSAAERSPEDIYLETLEHRFSQPNRCC
jgi:carbon starvation protein